MLGCANATGTCRLPLAFIHKSAKPRCFTGMDMSQLPVHYFSQHNAWMSASIFEKWFHDFFVPRAKKFCSEMGIEYKILLLLDNAPVHPTLEILKSRDGKVTSMFLPPNTTSILQPMDQGILESMKRRYKKRLLRHLIIENEASSLPIPNILKKLTIKEAVYWSAHAWEETKQVTLNRAWNKLLLPSHTSSVATTTGGANEEPAPTSEATDVSDDLEDFDSLFQDLGFTNDNPDWLTPAEWLAQDTSDPGYQLLSDDEIVAMVVNEGGESEDESSEEPTTTCVTHAQAYSALETALTWLESQTDTDPAHLLLVRRWRNSAAMKRTQTQTQTKISSYFS